MIKSLENLLFNLEEADTKLKEIYLPSHGNYVQRITNLKKSLTQKKNWVKDRFKYMIGIRRANLFNPYKDIRKSFLNNKK